MTSKQYLDSPSLPSSLNRFSLSSLSFSPQVLVEKLGSTDSKLNKQLLQAKTRSNAAAQGFSDAWNKDYTKLATLEFNRERKSMSVLGKAKVGGSSFAALVVTLSLMMSL